MTKRKENPKPGGRPPKWSSPEDIQVAIDAYLQATPENQYRITALALALNLTRQGLCEYEAKPEFSDTIKKAKLRVESSYEADLRGKAVAGAIFALKNMGWSDKQDLKVEGGITVNINPVQFGDRTPDKES